MKKLKKFEEQGWASDPLDSPELPDPAGFDLDFKDEDNLEYLIEDMAEEVYDILQKYYTQIIRIHPEYDRNDVIDFLSQKLKTL
jgi:hypothetical protein